MNLLTLENLAKSFGERSLFSKVTFGVDEGDKVGLIGVNGTGKSTFLKVIAGIEPADAGKVVFANGIQVEYLPQNPEFDERSTVLEQVFAGTSPVMRLIRDYEETLIQADELPENAILQKKLFELSHQMDVQNAWQFESNAKSILTKLEITDFGATVGSLSGGQRKRIALGSALVKPADLLILDEPTNHIDNDMVVWLENFLQSYKGALLMVTHDRYFLDRVSNRVIEIDRGQLYSYTGNYTKFLEIKADREELLEGSERKRKNLLRNELAWIRRGAKARSTKQKARIERFEKLSSQHVELRQYKLDIEIGATRLGRKIIELEHINQQFGNKTLIRDFNYIVLRDDRIGIVGPNGCGKSTLLNIIAGVLPADSGSVVVGQTVKIGYFSQENEEMDVSLRVIDYIKEEANIINTLDGKTLSASQMLERFLFPASVQWMPIAKLSGGERRRLFLLRILMGAPNVLLLDEPTNDLDIQTLTVLEDYLDDFPGAVIAVSHDRFFLDRLADKIFSFEDRGTIRQYAGGYSDFLEKRLSFIASSESFAKAPNAPKASVTDKKKNPTKFTFNEQREFDQIEDIISDLEQRLQELGKEIESAASDFEKLQLLVDRQQMLERELEMRFERWTYLNELAESLKKRE